MASPQRWSKNGNALGATNRQAGSVTYDYDLIAIGMGPAGMAASAMAAEMGLTVCGIEKHKLGGECMNVGCIPSKALLRMAELRHSLTRLDAMELESLPLPAVKKPFPRIQGHLDYILREKTIDKFSKVDLVMGEGAASFVDAHTVQVGERRLRARRIFICTGTRASRPPIPGLETVDVLDNENLFHLAAVPESLLIIGGGAIGSEMAQAFSRLGSRVAVVHMDAHLLPFAPPEAGRLLEAQFVREGIAVYNQRRIASVAQENGRVRLGTAEGEDLSAERLLLAAGRTPVLQGLALEKAGVHHTAKGIPVNDNLQTNVPHIYAVGDCNGTDLFSHAAMHQAMIALFNILRPRPFKKSFRRYAVPWTVFTDPQVSFVGRLEGELAAAGVAYEVLEAKYEDFGAAIAENVATGFVRVFASRSGRVYGACVVGEGSAEMINEWALILQKNIRLHDVALLQHSFPSMSCLNKSIGEMWMMRRMRASAFMRRVMTVLMRR